MNRLRQRPDVGCVPAFSLGNNVAEARALQDSGVVTFQPMIEPGERFDVQALPRPRQAMLTHHRDSYVLAVSEFCPCGERMWQMQRHVLPIAADVGRDLYPIQQRQQIAVFPPCVAQRVLRSDGPPQIIPWMWSV